MPLPQPTHQEWQGQLSSSTKYRRPFVRPYQEQAHPFCNALRQNCCVWAQSLASCQSPITHVDSSWRLPSRAQKQRALNAFANIRRKIGQRTNNIGTSNIFQRGMLPFGMIFQAYTTRLSFSLRRRFFCNSDLPPYIYWVSGRKWTVSSPSSCEIAKK